MDGQDEEHALDINALRRQVADDDFALRPHAMQHAVREGFTKEMKALITVCSECQTKTELREITIEFQRKSIRAVMSGIRAMVCPNCGEKHVPGDIAGDVIDTVSRTIDETEWLFKTTEARRKKLASDRFALSPERLELALVL